MSIRPPHHCPKKPSRYSREKNDRIVTNENNRKNDYNAYFINDINELLSLISNSNLSKGKKDYYLSCVNSIVISYKKRSNDITDNKQQLFGIDRDIFELYKSYIPIICEIKFYLKMDIDNSQKETEANKKIGELEESIKSLTSNTVSYEVLQPLKV